MRRPLLGVPVAVKDDMDVAGEPTAFGCRGEFPPAAADGEAVRRLRAAGAVIVGKTNTCELGQWPFTEGPAFGETRNPWDTRAHAGRLLRWFGRRRRRRTGPGRARLRRRRLGAHPGRLDPADRHQPQRGRISMWPRAESFNGITVNGTLARTVADAALLLDAATAITTSTRTGRPR